MAEYNKHVIAAVDPGNGETDAGIFTIGSKKPKFFSQPSVRAMTTGQSLGLGADKELQYDVVQWYDSTYVTGDDVLRMSRRGLERHMGEKRYGDDLHQFLVASALARMGVNKATVDLTLCVPPGFYRSMKDTVKKAFMVNDGHVTIKRNGKLHQWQYTNITVRPEGLGAIACFLLDENGVEVENDILDGDVVIFDIGAYTLDSFRLRDGRFDPEDLDYSTWKGDGINEFIREPLLRAIKKRDYDFGNLTVDDIDAMLRAGESEISAAGKTESLAREIQYHAEDYAGWINANVIGSRFDDLRGVKVAILIGGGAHLVGSLLEQIHGKYGKKGGKILIGKNPGRMNADGCLRLAMMEHRLRTETPA